jgi:tRNA(adenine34) deaminase
MINPFSDEFFMKEALKEAQKALDADEVPVGAVLVANNRIISRAHNQVEALNDPTAHAEMIAITAGCNSIGNKFLEDCVLYVSLEPCPMCAGALNWSRVGKVVYAAKDPKGGCSIFSPSILHPKTKFLQGDLNEESLTLLQTFFNSKR